MGTVPRDPRRLTLRCSRPRAVRWPGAEAPRSIIGCATARPPHASYLVRQQRPCRSAAGTWRHAAAERKNVRCWGAVCATSCSASSLGGYSRSRCRCHHLGSAGSRVCSRDERSPQSLVSQRNLTFRAGGALCPSRLLGFGIWLRSARTPRRARQHLTQPLKLTRRRSLPPSHPASRSVILAPDAPRSLAATVSQAGGLREATRTGWRGQHGQRSTEGFVRRGSSGLSPLAGYRTSCATSPKRSLIVAMS